MKPVELAVWAGLLVGWFALALYYISCTPDLRLHHDAAAHVEYSALIAAEHKLPEPHRSLETHQPPLFYLLCQLFQPLPAESEPGAQPIVMRLGDRTQFTVRAVDTKSVLQHLVSLHIPRVRDMSAVFGLLFLACCAGLLFRTGAAGWPGMVAFVYIATLPSVLILLTAYNNDALAALFGAALLLALHWSYDARPSIWKWLAIAVCMAGGAYAKLSVGCMGVAICIGLVLLFAFRRMAFSKTLFLGSAIACGGLSILPWALLHNVPLSGKLLPANVTDPAMWAKSEIYAAGSLKNWSEKLQFFLTPPGITDGEWADPYIQDGRTYHWKRNLASHMLVTSVFDEFVYGPSPTVVNRCAWISLWAQAAIFGIALLRARSGPPFAWAALAAALVVQIMVLLSYPELHHTNFRMYAWAALPLSVLIAQNVQWTSRPSLRCVAYLGIVLAGIAAHVGMIVHIM